MNEKICMSKNYFFIILFLFISLTILHLYYLKNNNLFGTNISYNLDKNLNNIPTKHYHKTINNNLVQKDNDLKEITYTTNTTTQLPDEQNIYLNQPKNIIMLPLKNYLENRDRSILNDPLVAPEKRLPWNDNDSFLFTPSIEAINIINQPLYKPQFNIPTRGIADNYQLIGILFRDQDEKIVQLFGRPTYPSSNQFEYYIVTETNGFSNKIPIVTKGNREINDNDDINTIIGNYRVKLYNYNAPRYNPYI